MECIECAAWDVRTQVIPQSNCITKASQQLVEQYEAIALSLSSMLLVFNGRQQHSLTNTCAVAARKQIKMQKLSKNE